MTMDSNDPGTARLQSLDIVRGAIMILMAIDHVRVYAGLPPGGPTAGIFFTRWITNFCAPGFVFFAGTAAFLYGIKVNNRDKLVRFLLLRGLVLVILEVTIIRFFWTFNLDYHFVIAGVIWMLGWCMIALALFTPLRPAIAAVIGILIILGQSLFGYVPAFFPADWSTTIGVWRFIYPWPAQPHEGMAVLYVLVPWIGVMAAGYGFGAIMQLEPIQRKRRCLQIGLVSIALFLAIGTAALLAKPDPENETPFIFQLLNQRKYPASPLFLLMTLGPLLALVPAAEKAKGWAAGILRTVGSVPMFYYLLHILLIHSTALIVNMIRNGDINAAWYASAPFSQVPEQFRWGLPLLYFVFAIDLIVLVGVCRMYARYKFAHPEKKWLKYL
jgi:uncharacterized membrane protein